MPTVFEEYAPYRPAITADEQEMLDEGRRNQEELLADPTVKHWERGWIDAEGRLAPYPLQNNQMQIALDRADQQLRRWGADPTLFPVDLDTTVRFPGVNPKGKACEVDMAFAQRRARLEAALSSRPPEVRAYVGRQLKDLTQLNTPMRNAWDKMKVDCYDIRMTTLAARMAVTEETSQWLLEDAQARKGSSNITKMGSVLNVLEYLSGGITVLMGVLLVLFLNTRLGLSIRATGDNRDMVRASSINPTFTITTGLCLANALTGLSGAVVGQAQKTADINGGTGIVVIGLACLIIGETIVGRGAMFRGAIAVILGSILYRFIYAIVLYTKVVPVDCLKLVTAIVVALAIAMPTLKQWVALQNRKRRAMAARKGAR